MAASVAVGDRVRWVEYDDDIPEGSIGVVTGFMPNGRARCRFPLGTFALQPFSLRLVDAPDWDGRRNSGSGSSSGGGGGGHSVCGTGSKGGSSGGGAAGRAVASRQGAGLDLLLGPTLATSSTPRAPGEVPAPVVR